MLSFPVVIYFIILYNIIRVVLQEIGILLGVLSDCEELVGVDQRHQRCNTFTSFNTQAHQKQQGHDKWGFVSRKNPKQ